MGGCGWSVAGRAHAAVAAHRYSPAPLKDGGVALRFVDVGTPTSVRRYVLCVFQCCWFAEEACYLGAVCWFDLAQRHRAGEGCQEVAYYVSGKEELLVALLESTVAPSLAYARGLGRGCGSCAGLMSRCCVVGSSIWAGCISGVGEGGRLVGGGGASGADRSCFWVDRGRHSGAAGRS